MTANWWQSRWAIAMAMIASTIPLWFVHLPPLIDLLAHMGRYHIQLNIHDNPVLQANWAFKWQVLGNLGGDLLMEPLGRLFGVERGTIILGALLPPLMIWGMVRLARAVHGAVPASVWAAFPFAMAYPWHYGLVNYWLGSALALHAAAWWYRRWPGERGAAASLRDALLLGLVALGLWVVHIYGWAIFCVLVGARALGAVPWRRWIAVAPQLLPVTAPIVPMVLLAYGARGSQETYGWFIWARKLGALIFTLRDQWQPLDIASLALAATLIYAALRSKQMRFDRTLGVAALILLVSVAIIPFQALGSAFADGRLWPLVFIVALLAMRFREGYQGKAPAWLALGATTVFAVRLAVTTVGFQAYDAAYAHHLQALDKVERGAKIAVFLEFPCDVAWRRPRLDHLDGLAIVRRDAFTNAQWDVPGAQLLAPLGAVGTRYNADPSQLVRRRDCPADLRPVLAYKIARFPRDRFGYVWVLGFDPVTLPRYAGLTPLFADDRTILYRIEK
jgi:hypothetical protein